VKLSAKNILGYTLVWLFIIMLSLSGSFFSSVLLDAPFHLRTELPFLARWIVWIPLTPIAVSLAEKKMYAASKPASFIAISFRRLSLCLHHPYFHGFALRHLHCSLSSAATQLRHSPEEMCDDGYLLQLHYLWNDPAFA